MKRVIPVLIGLVAMAIIAFGLVSTVIKERYEPTKDLVDYASVMGLKENEYTITVNGTVIEDIAVEAEGRVYMNKDLVARYMNSRFYFDQNNSDIIYTTGTENQIYEADQPYYTSGEQQVPTDAPVLRKIGEEFYLDVAYVNELSKCDVQIYSDPRRVVIRNNWDPAESVRVSAEESYVRYQGGIKSPVFSQVAKGDELTALETIDDWTRVATDDGYIGYIENKDITERYMRTFTEPEDPVPEYSHITRDHDIVMVWHQVMSEYASSTITGAIANIHGVNVISPTWFSFDGDEGGIRSIATQEYVSIAHNAGMEVWALFSNEFDGIFDGGRASSVLSDTDKRKRIIDTVVGTCISMGIDGLNLDFEGMPEATIDNYLQFVRELSVECRKNDLVLSVDIYVPTYTKYYNRGELADYIDYLIIMGYDQYTSGSAEPGPTADVPFVKKGIEDTLLEVPAERVINGIPFYSLVWNNNESGGFSLEGNYDMPTAKGFIINHGAEIEYIEDLGINYGTYVSDINGSTYRIWLSDEVSTESYLKLIDEYGLAGVSCWKLGMEGDVDVWSVIDKYLDAENE